MKQRELFKKSAKAYGGVLFKTRKGRSHGRPLSTRDKMHLVLRSSKAVGDWSFKKPKNEKKIKVIIDKFAIKYGVKILSLANVGNHLHFHIKLTNRFTYRPFIRAITSAIMMAVTGVNRWSKKKHNKFDEYKKVYKNKNVNKSDKYNYSDSDSYSEEKIENVNINEGDLDYKRVIADDSENINGNKFENGNERESENNYGKGLKEKFWDLRPFTRVVQSSRAHLNLRDYIQINRLEGEGFHRLNAYYLVKERLKWAG